MNQENDVVRRRKIFMIAVYVAIMFIAIAGWVALSVGRTPKDEAKVENIDKVNLDVVPKIRSIVQKRLREAIDLAYGIDDDKDPIGIIRKETVTTKTEKDGTKLHQFIVDVDNYELTYRAEVWERTDKDESQAYFYCVPPDQSKYPNRFCIGYNGQSTIDVTIGYSLPLSAKETKNGYFYDAKIKYTENSIRPYIDIFVSSCGNQRIVDEVREDFRDWITEQGYNAEIYDIQVPDYCTGGE